MLVKMTMLMMLEVTRLNFTHSMPERWSPFASPIMQAIDHEMNRRVLSEHQLIVFLPYIGDDFNVLYPEIGNAFEAKVWKLC